MSAPVHQIFLLAFDAVLLGAVAANLSVGWYAWATHKKRRAIFDALLADITNHSACYVEGHDWHIETFPLQTKVTERMTVLVKCECETCLTRLDFQVVFGIDYPGAGHAHPWASIEPTPPPG